MPRKAFDTSGKSLALLHHPAICRIPMARARGTAFSRGLHAHCEAIIDAGMKRARPIVMTTTSAPGSGA
jgi:hypothetical protein